MKPCQVFQVKFSTCIGGFLLHLFNDFIFFWSSFSGVRAKKLKDALAAFVLILTMWRMSQIGNCMFPPESLVDILRNETCRENESQAWHDAAFESILPFNPLQILSMGMMTEYYHFFFTTLVSRQAGLKIIHQVIARSWSAHMHARQHNVRYSDVGYSNEL